MKVFSRKIEKILAWIANVIMILITALISLGAFSSQLATALKQPQLEPLFYNLLQDPGISALLSSSGMDIISLFIAIVRVYAVGAIVVTVIALIASFIMRARVPVYLLYFIVAIMLFVRKPPKNNVETDFRQTPEKPQIDRLEYL